jgi:hypothetical protein
LFVRIKNHGDGGHNWCELNWPHAASNVPFVDQPVSTIMFGQLPRKPVNKKAYDELKSSLIMFASLVATVRFIPYLLAGVQKASSS